MAPSPDIQSTSRGRSRRPTQVAFEIEAASATELLEALAGHKTEVTDAVSDELSKLLERLKPTHPDLVEALRPYLQEASGNILVEVGNAGATLQDKGREVARSQLKRQAATFDEKMETLRKAATVDKQNLETSLTAEFSAQLKEAKALMDIGDAKKAKATIDGLRAELEEARGMIEGMEARVASAEATAAEAAQRMKQHQAELDAEREAARTAQAKLDSIRDEHQYEMDLEKMKSGRILAALVEAASEAERVAVHDTVDSLQQGTSALALRLRDEQSEAERSGVREEATSQLERLTGEMTRVQQECVGLDGQLRSLRAEAAAREAAARMGEDEVVSLRLDVSETRRQLSEALRSLGVQIEENRTLAEFAEQLVFSFREERAELQAAIQEADASVRIDKAVMSLRSQLEECDEIIQRALHTSQPSGGGAARAGEGGGATATAAAGAEGDGGGGGGGRGGGGDDGFDGAPARSPTPDNFPADIPPTPFPRPKSAFKRRSSLLDQMMETDRAPLNTAGRAHQLAKAHASQTQALKTSLAQLLSMTETLAALEAANDASASRIDALRENARRERTVLVQTALSSLSQLRSYLTTTLSGMTCIDVRRDGEEGSALRPLPRAQGSPAESHWERWKREFAVKAHPKPETIMLRYTPPVSARTVALSHRGARMPVPEEYATRPATAPQHFSPSRALAGAGGGGELGRASPERRPRTSGGIDRARSGHSAIYSEPFVQMSSIPISAPATPRYVYGVGSTGNGGGGGGVPGGGGGGGSAFPTIKTATAQPTTIFGDALPPGGGLTMRDLQEGAVSRPMTAASDRHAPPAAGSSSPVRQDGPGSPVAVHDFLRVHQ